MPPRHHFRRHGPPRAVRRMGCMFAAMIVCAAIGAGAFVSFFTHAGPPLWVIPLAAMFLIAIVAVFITTFRRVTHFFREQDRLRRQLMADVAHELRTPLTILQGRVEGMLDGVYPRDEEHLRELLAETQHLARLVEDVRTLANAEAGALDLRKEPVDLRELIREAASTAGASVDVPPDLPAIEADPTRIREILLNLLTNAAEHAPDGEVSIRADVRGRMIVVQVRDSGPGIPEDELPHVFDRFRKGPRSRGTGLGLAIAQKLVRAHGGEIAVASTVGQGTVVTVSLPR